MLFTVSRRALSHCRFHATRFPRGGLSSIAANRADGIFDRLLDVRSYATKTIPWGAPSDDGGEEAGSEVEDELPFYGAQPIWLEDDGGHTHKLVEWYKEVGDKVEEEESLCEIETEAFSYDITSPFEGFLAKKCQKESAEMADESLILLLVSSQEELDKFIAAESAEPTAPGAAPAGPTTDVGDWLGGLTDCSKLTQYSEAFEEEGFDSMDIVKAIDEDDLKDMGVKKGHRKVILEAVGGLNAE